LLDELPLRCFETGDGFAHSRKLRILRGRHLPLWNNVDWHHVFGKSPFFIDALWLLVLC
jgi:hypothetical protein